MTEVRQSVHGSWNSRWTFILAATGSAVGLGNIWKFPYITGENGGGAFVAFYLLCIALFGIPILMAEILLGRRSRKSPAMGMRVLCDESKASSFWIIIGWMGSISGILILSYYSVIAGWSLQFVWQMGSGSLNGQESDVVAAGFAMFLNSPEILTFWHSIFMAMVMIVVARGINRGLGNAVNILMPLLFILLLVLLGFSMRTDSYDKAVHFLFDVDFSKLTLEACLTAMGHAFFSLSLGMGAMMAYGAYLSSKASIASTAFLVGFLDTVVALLAGLAIFPIVFANGLDPQTGPSLMFISLPISFAALPGGQFFGMLFFILVAFAAWSSAISLIEPAVAWSIEKFKVTRAKACFVIGTLTWVIGMGTVFSFNIWKEKTYLGFTVFNGLDFLTSNILLPLGGLFVALFVGYAMKSEHRLTELGWANGVKNFGLLLSLRFIAPLVVVIIFLTGLLDKFYPGLLELFML